MKEEIKFTYSWIENEEDMFDGEAPKKIITEKVYTLNSCGLSLPEVFEQFEQFLRGCGFVFNGNIDIVEDSLEDQINNALLKKRLKDKIKEFSESESEEETKCDCPSHEDMCMEAQMADEEIEEILGTPALEELEEEEESDFWEDDEIVLIDSETKEQMIERHKQERRAMDKGHIFDETEIELIDRQRREMRDFYEKNVK